MKPWEEKANRLINNACRASYLRANTSPTGRKYARHVQYTVPELAEHLIDCLNRGDEEKAKALFLTYDGIKAHTVYVDGKLAPRF